MTTRKAHTWPERLTRDVAQEARDLIREGWTKQAICLRLFGSKASNVVNNIAEDVRAGEHLYDPVDDEVAIARVLEFRDKDVAERLSVFERERVKAALWERYVREGGLEREAKDPQLPWIDGYARCFGHQSKTRSREWDFMRSCERSWERVQAGVL